MPSARRLRVLLFTAVLATLVLFYINSAARQTESSPFYTKTAALTNARERERIAALREEQRGTAQAENIPVENTDSVADFKADEDLRARLKDAAEAAKKSADDKYQELVAADPKLALSKLSLSSTVTLPSTSTTSSAPEMTLPPAHPVPPKGFTDEKILKAGADPAAAGVPPPPPGSGPDAARKPYPKPEGVEGADGVAKVGNVGPGGALKSSTTLSTSTSTAATTTTAELSEEAKASQALAAADAEMNDILRRSPTIIFSKSYCPHSAKAKRILLEAHAIVPAPHVVELDQHPQGAALQRLLADATGRRTVPNVLVNGKSVGGGDEMQNMWENGKVEAIWTRYGAGKIQSVKVLQKFGEQPRRGGGGRDV